MEKRRTSIVIIFFMLNICSDLFYKLIKLIAKLTYYILINCSLDAPLFLFFCKYEYLSFQTIVFDFAIAWLSQVSTYAAIHFFRFPGYLFSQNHSCSNAYLYKPILYQEFTSGSIFRRKNRFINR